MNPIFSPLNPPAGNNPLVPENYDRINVAYTSTTDVYTYLLNGNTVGTITVTYVDSTKAQITSVVAS